MSRSGFYVNFAATLGMSTPGCTEGEIAGDNGGAREGRPIHFRIFAITSGSSMTARIVIWPPQRPHSRTSTRKYAFHQLSPSCEGYGDIARTTGWEPNGKDI